MKLDPSICETGCNVSSLFIPTSSQDMGSASHACLFEEGSGLRAEETVYIPENNTCHVVTCSVSEGRVLYLYRPIFF